MVNILKLWHKQEDSKKVKCSVCLRDQKELIPWTSAYKSNSLSTELPGQSVPSNIISCSIINMYMLHIFLCY